MHVAIIMDGNGRWATQRGLPRAAAGIVNSLSKTISPTDESTGATETLHNMLQTDADVVSGDSGGPLANGAGQVIGMTTANASSSQSSSSVLGYAIPIDTALAVAHQIAAGQRSRGVQIGLPGFLGVLVPQSGSSSPQHQAAQQRQQEKQQSGAGSGSGNGPGSGTGPTPHPAPPGPGGDGAGQPGGPGRRSAVRYHRGHGRAGQRRRDHGGQRPGGDQSDRADPQRIRAGPRHAGQAGLGDDSG